MASATARRGWHPVQSCNDENRSTGLRKREGSHSPTWMIMKKAAVRPSSLFLGP